MKKEKKETLVHTPAMRCEEDKVDDDEDET